MAKKKPASTPTSDYDKLRKLEGDEKGNLPKASRAEIAELLKERPEGIQPKDYAYEIAQTLRAPVPDLRQRVAQVTRSAGRAHPVQATPEPQPVSKIDQFEKIVEASPELSHAFDALNMLCDLLRNSYRPSGSVYKLMGFDQDNLDDELQAAFILAKGKPVMSQRIYGYLTQPNRTTLEVFYYQLLGLNDDSTEDEMRQRANRLEDKMERELTDLMNFRQRLYVEDALCDIEESDGNETPEEIVRRYGFTGDPIRFDVEANKRIREEAELRASGKPIPARPAAPKPVPVAVPQAPQPAPQVLDCDKFYQENGNHPALVTLIRIHEALNVDPGTFTSRYQARYFEGDDVDTVIERLNLVGKDLYDIDGLGNLLILADTHPERIDLLQQIADKNQIKNNAALGQKLNEIQQMILARYPKLK